MCLEWNRLFAQASICSPFAATNLFGAVLRWNFTRGNIPSGMTWAAAPETMVALAFTQLSFTANQAGIRTRTLLA